jgi:hypothetical protein
LTAVSQTPDTAAWHAPFEPPLQEFLALQSFVPANWPSCSWMAAAIAPAGTTKLAASTLSHLSLSADFTAPAGPHALTVQLAVAPPEELRHASQLMVAPALQSLGRAVSGHRQVDDRTHGMGRCRAAIQGRKTQCPRSRLCDRQLAFPILQAAGSTKWQGVLLLKQ